MPRASVITVLGLVILLQSTPAAAGGWWSYIDIGTRFVSEGQRFQFEEEILFEALDDVEGAREGTVPYYAYLVDDIDQGMLDEAMSKPFDRDWWRVSGEATRIGEITLDRWDSNLAWARIDMTIPSLPSGRYWLMLCNDGCRKPLADVVPSPIFVVQDLPTARYASKVMENIRVLREKLGPLDRSVEMAWDRANAAHSRVAELELRLDRVERLLVRERDEGGRLAFAWIPFFGGAALVGFGTWARRRLRACS